MKKHLPLSLLACLLLAVAAWLPSAQAQQMNYQGRLTDTNGNALADGQFTLTFNLYAAASGGAAVWGPFICDSTAGPGHAPKADLVSGRFNVILGSLDTAGRPLPPAFTGGTPRYLGIKVATGTEISPRQQILAAPEALHALIADTVPNGAIGTAQIADGSITAEKINGGTGVWVGNGQDIYRLNGNVGIGTATPAAKLDITGNANITGTLQVQNPGADTGNIHVGAYGSTAGNPKLINFGDGDFVHVGESAADDTLELKGTRISMVGNVGIGVTDPAARLDVRGDIKLGPTGQYFAPAAEENLRIVRGWGTANTTVGTVFGPLSGVGSGFTYTKISQGVVDVQFNTAFASVPCVTANTITGESVFCAVGPYGGGSWTGAGIRITMFDSGGAARDWPFNFIAIGPR